MNVNPDSIRILCFGDSLTWGHDPKTDGLRYPANVRWTGQLQEKLGNNFEIIEEGLCGRTTILDDPKEEGRNGKTYLKPCLLSHNPLDLVVLLLGSNDLKERFNLSSENIARNAEELVMIIKELGCNKDNKPPKILLISPPLVSEDCKLPMEGMKGAVEKSKQFAHFYKEVADRQNCEFIDLAQYVEPSNIDGCHLEQASQAKVVEVLEEKIKVLYR